MRTFTQRLLSKTFLFILLIAPLSRCTPIQNSAPRHQVRSTAPWEGRLQELFDDSVDRSAVGLAGSSESHAGGLLGQRAEEAHYIVRVRVATVTTEGSGNDQRYLITLRVVGDPIAGPRPPGKDIQVTVGQNSQSFGIVKAKDLALAGTHFIAFLREFDQQGTPTLHWHLARDGQDVIDAARKGSVLSELSED